MESRDLAAGTATSPPSMTMARNPGPLIVALLRDHGGEGRHIHAMDLPGHVVKRVPIPIPSGYHETLLRSRLDLICVGDGDGNGSCCCLINPATGAASHLPKTDIRYKERWLNWESEPDYSVFALGRVDSTEECKMLKLSNLYYGTDEMVCNVLTVNGAAGDTGWRSAGSPEFTVNMDSGVVVGRAVYYFWADTYTHKFRKAGLSSDGLPDCIASFDLGIDHWTTIPVPRIHHANNDKIHEYVDMWSQSTLAELKGYLVLVAHTNRRYSSCLDLWFLTDIHNGLWVKEYSIQAPKEVMLGCGKFVEPLLLLDDGRIIIFLHLNESLLLYDPTTNVFSEVETTRLRKVALYTGSLLSLQTVANV